MSEQVVNIPRERFEEMASAPLRIAQMDANKLMQAGDVAGANRRLAEGVAESAAIRSQIVPQSAATSPANPAAPAAAPVPVSPLASPGTPPPHVPAIPAEQLPGESLGAFYVRRGQAIRQAAQGVDGQFDLSRAMGLRSRR